MHDTVAPERVLPLLRGRFGHPYRYALSCASSQLLLDESDPEGAVAACEEQTAGRGRLGRRWEAPAGAAILCSLLLRPPPGRNPAELSLVAGLAVAEAVEEAGGLATSIKWPNDVLVGGRKVAGVLAEARPPAVVLGVGVNVGQRAEQLPPDARLPAASLSSLGRHRVDRAELLARLLLRLEGRYERWLGAGLDPLLQDLRARDALAGRTIRIDSLEGVAAGIDRDGRLLVRTQAGVVPVASGEVTATIELEQA